MPRKKREWYEGATYHVMARGNRRCAIFKTPEDYELFTSLLQEIRKKYPFDIHAFCLMTNHFHLELTTKDVPIWRIMQPLLTKYARIFNKTHGYDGHLFDSRYTSCLITDFAYFLEVSRYIHLNPVKAGMVRKPLEYEYSSYSCYVEGEEERGGIAIETEKVLRCFFDNSREQYRLFVEGDISHEEQEVMIQKDMKEDDTWQP